MRKKMTAVILAVLVFSLIAASAASLGGINTADLGADATVVASCDTVGGVDADYNWTYTPGAPGFFDVDDVVVSSIDAACIGYTIEVTLGDGSSILGTGTGTVAGASITVAITPSGTEVDAELVTELGIVISN